MVWYDIILKRPYDRWSFHPGKRHNVDPAISSWSSIPKPISGSTRPTMLPFNPMNTTFSPSQFMSILPLGIRLMNRIMHGLGFISSWSSYLPNNPNTLTPQVALGNPASSNGIQFEGFVEFAYDRLMSFTNHPGLYATNLSADMISAFGQQGTVFRDDVSLGNAFASSTASKYGRWMDTNATEKEAIQQSLPVPVATNATLQTFSTPGPLITLETSFHPFASGSSLNHVDAELYGSTQDFLMRYSTPMGKTLQEFIDDYGASGDTTYGPFGPGLRYILAGIGYRVKGGIPLGGSYHNPSSQSGTQGGSATNSTTQKSMATPRMQTCGWNIYWAIILGSCFFLFY